MPSAPPRRKGHKRGELVNGMPVKNHPLYTTWALMISRCFNPKNSGWVNYGGRGITVNESWLSFKNFANDMYPKPTPLHTLDRIDNDKGYSRENCKWSTRTEQCLNRRVFNKSKTRIAGVTEKSGGYMARVQVGSVRYQLGVYASKEEASRKRSVFLKNLSATGVVDETLLKDKNNTLWSTSSTKVRGVTKNSGGFTVRCTIKKVRYYVGWFRTIEDAVAAREGFIASRAGEIENKT